MTLATQVGNLIIARHTCIAQRLQDLAAHVPDIDRRRVNICHDFGPGRGGRGILRSDNRHGEFLIVSDGIEGRSGHEHSNHEKNRNTHEDRSPTRSD